ncbi:MAG: type II secretion system protein [Planctomycetota bacterium]|nr:type II secretion system protein [Planctomycetota bacterium]
MSRRAFSMIGMLMTLLCIGILMAIALPAFQKSMTGIKEEGGKAAVSGWGLQDQVHLYALMQGLNTVGLSTGDGMPVPSEVSGRRDISEDTTANLYSYLVMQRFISPDHLVSPADYMVDPDDDYDWSAYDPRAGVYWDPSFEADLTDISNVSYAHMPLYGDRLKDNWGSRMRLSSSFPLFGNRGPEDGIETEESYACFDGRWGGYVAFGDGHIEFLDSPAAFRGGIRGGGPDELFSIDDTTRHADAILGFTYRMHADGPELQWD